METIPAFISFEEVAKRLGLSRSTIERMVERGEFIQPFRFSRGALRFDADELKAWIAQRRQSPGNSQLGPTPAIAPRASTLRAAPDRPLSVWQQRALDAYLTLEKQGECIVTVRTLVARIAADLPPPAAGMRDTRAQQAARAIRELALRNPPHFKIEPAERGGRIRRVLP